MAELIVQCDEEEFDAALFSRCGGAACEADAPLSVEVVFTDAEGIRKLNADTRGKDAVTDVLSYPNLDGIFGKKIAKAEHPFDLDDEGNIFLGSIVICRERAAEQAEEYGHSLRREVYYLAVHRALPPARLRPRNGRGARADARKRGGDTLRNEHREGRAMKSGFVAVIGKANAGKSTLVNVMVGERSPSFPPSRRPRATASSACSTRRARRSPSSIRRASINRRRRCRT